MIVKSNIRQSCNSSVVRSSRREVIREGSALTYVGTLSTLTLYAGVLGMRVLGNVIKKYVIDKCVKYLKTTYATEEDTDRRAQGCGR